MIGKTLLVLALVNFAATGCYGGNCGLQNCGDKQFCCKRLQSSISRCYYDKPPIWYSCEYVEAVSTSHVSYETTSQVSPTITTKEITTESHIEETTVPVVPRALEISVSTSTNATVENLTTSNQNNNCGVQNCSINEYCCQRSRSSISRCYYDRPPTWYSCKYIKALSASYVTTKTTSTITPTLSTEETTTELDKTTVTTVPRALEITEGELLTPTKPNQDNNCGVQNCGINQFCCQRSRASISRCYYDRPPTWYSCKYIKATILSSKAAKMTSTVPVTLTTKETTTESDNDGTTASVGLGVAETSSSDMSKTTSAVPQTLPNRDNTTKSVTDLATSSAGIRVLEIPESSTTEAHLEISTTAKPSYNCGRRNCPENRFCCKRFGASWSVCYYDRLPFMYRCKYIYASKDKYYLPEKTSTVKPKTTTTQTATTRRSAYAYQNRAFPWIPPYFLAKWWKY